MAQAPAPPAAGPPRGCTPGCLGACSFLSSRKTPQLHGKEQEGQKEDVLKKTANWHYFLTVVANLLSSA